MAMNIKPGAPFSMELFKVPPLECEVVYSWSWNAPITREGIDERLADISAAGIKSIYILPIPMDFNPENLRSYLAPDYLSKEFFELVDYALRRAIELGMKPWIYDEGGWPSGGACYHTVRENPNAKLKFLKKEEVFLASDKRFYPSGEDFIALYHGKNRLPDDYIASSDITVTAYYLEKVIQRGSRIDYTSESATDTFIKNTYEAYKAQVGDLFGKHIPAIFTDEPGLMWNSVAENEFKLFEQEYGYDLRDYIYVIEEHGELAVTGKEKQARIDHIALLGKLSKKNFYEKLRDWCESEGVYFSGHLDIDNRPFGGTTKGYFSLMEPLRCMHIPGIDAIWEHIRYPYGGRAPVNDETLGMGFFPRLASSAARQEGRNLALTETFSINGDSITPDEMRYEANYQAVRGINVFNFMAMPYGKTRCDALSARPSWCPEKPGFFNLKHLNEYYARLSYLLRLGHAEGDVALYLPACDFAACPDDLDDANASFKALGTSLEARCIAFDIIDDGGIRDAKDTGEGLLLGDALYRSIAVPACKHMPEDVKKKIEKYLGEGVSTYEFENKFLRVMTRKLDTGRLWFVFNEGIDHAEETLELPEGKRIYSLDLRYGGMYQVTKACVDLPAGDMAVFLVTDEKYASSPSRVKYSVDAISTTPLYSKRFLIDYYGFKHQMGEGMPELDKDFSGEVTVAVDYELPEKPFEGELYRIILDGFSVTASLDISGKRFSAGMTPMYIELDGGLLEKRGILNLTVANTAANEVIAKNDVIVSHPKAEVGNYHSRILVFEERRPPLKIGIVKIEKLV